MRCAFQFVLMNLLLAPLKEGASMLRLLLLFLPLVTLAFGWLYYRFDSGARRQGRSHITFNDPGDTAVAGHWPGWRRLTWRTGSIGQA